MSLSARFTLNGNRFWLSGYLQGALAETGLLSLELVTGICNEYKLPLHNTVNGK